MYHSIIAIATFLSFLLLPLAVFADDSNSNNTQEFQLKNGLKLLVKEDHRAPIVFTSVWYKVGGSYEPRGITGISHALEHMMFRGTTKYGPGQFSEIINTNGGNQNAMTSEDFTVYYQTLPADKLAISFNLEADRMRHLSLDPNSFSKEIQVVMEERRMRTDDDPKQKTLERLNAIAYINNPYSQPLVGWMSDLQQMTVNDLKAWYQNWYQPNNAEVIVVGDVKPAQVLALANQYFGSLTSATITFPKPTQEVTRFGTRHLTVRLPAKLPWLIMAYNAPSLNVQNKTQPQPYVLTVLAYILGGGENPRLMKNLVRTQQVAVSASTDYNLYGLHNTLLTINAIPSKFVSLSNLIKAVQNEVVALQNTPVSAKELQTAKALIIAEHIFAKDSLVEQAISLAVPEMTGLSWRNELSFVNNIEAVTAEQIQAVAKQYLLPENLTIATLEPGEYRVNDSKPH